LPDAVGTSSQLRPSWTTRTGASGVSSMGGRQVDDEAGRFLRRRAGEAEGEDEVEGAAERVDSGREGRKAASDSTLMRRLRGEDEEEVSSGQTAQDGRVVRSTHSVACSRMRWSDSRSRCCSSVERP